MQVSRVSVKPYPVFHPEDSAKDPATMMQRSSSTMTRNILIGSVTIIVLLTILYYMKRVEIGRLKADVDSMVVQRADREDELNRKLTEYLQKLEDMTRQLGDINSRLQECEDNKATVVMELQKCKGINNECMSSKEAAESNLRTAQNELNKIKAQHESVSSQMSSHQQDMANIKISLADAERELQQCEDEKDACARQLRESAAHNQECQQREQSCQASLRAAGGGAARQSWQSNPGVPESLNQLPVQQQQQRPPVGGGNPVPMSRNGFNPDPYRAPINPQAPKDSRLQPPVVPGTHRLDTRAQETADEGASQGADEGGEGEEGEEDILPANVADEELENAEDDQAAPGDEEEEGEEDEELAALRGEEEEGREEEGHEVQDLLQAALNEEQDEDVL